MLHLIAGAVDDRSARGVAAAVSRLVHAGALPAGTRLPTVRSVATRLGISPTTVSEAWRSLAAAGAIETRGRSGTFVRALTRPREHLRYVQLGAQPTALPTDLSTGVPDHDLLPDLTGALRRIHDARLTTSYLDEPVLPALEEVLRQRWPFDPAQLTVVDGALDALDRITASVVRLGDRVLVENPAFPPVLDLLESAGAVPVPVALDEEGPCPDAFGAALRGGVVACYLQPRAQNPTGVSLTPERAERLADLLQHHPEVIVVEDDHAGDIASAPAVSLGAYLPDRTVRVHSFSKSHGPDLRLAAVAGAEPVIVAVADRRLLGPGWSSRLLQLLLLDLLTDPAATAAIDRARTGYAHRRQALLAELTARGATATAGDGINLWLTVGNQQLAMLALAAHGIAVAPGAPFEVSPLGADHVRVTVGLVRDGFAELATTLATAARTQSRGSGPRGLPLPRRTR